jgi:hypothetical protein
VLTACIVFVSFFATLAGRLQSEQVKGLVIGVGIVAFALSVCSGILGYCKLRSHYAEVFLPDYEACGEWIAKNTPRGAVFITSDSEYDAAIQYAGRVSYWHSTRAGWLYGFEDVRSGELAAFIPKADDPSILPRIRYVVQQRGKNSDRRGGEWALGNWSRVYSTDNYTIYARPE